MDLYLYNLPAEPFLLELFAQCELDRVVHPRRPPAHAPLRPTLRRKYICQCIKNICTDPARAGRPQRPSWRRAAPRWSGGRLRGSPPRRGCTLRCTGPSSAHRALVFILYTEGDPPFLLYPFHHLLCFPLP